MTFVPTRDYSALSGINQQTLSAVIVEMSPFMEQSVYIKLVKVSEHSFQVPMPNSSLLLNYLCFSACFLATVKVIKPQKGLFSLRCRWLRCVLLP